MEYLPGGELFDYVLEKSGLSEEKGREMFTQVVKAAQHCHEVSRDSTTKSWCKYPTVQLHGNYQ